MMITPSSSARPRARAGASSSPVNSIVNDVSRETAAGNSRRCFYNAQSALTEQRLGIAGKASAVVKSSDSTPPACRVLVFE